MQAVRGVRLDNAAVTTLVGGTQYQTQWLGGAADGVGTAAAVSLPSGLAVTNDSAVALIADFGNQRVRSLDLATLAVTTLLGAGPCPACARNVLDPGNGVAIAADGAILLSSNFSFGTVELWRCPRIACPADQYLRPCSIPTLNVSLPPCAAPRRASAPRAPPARTRTAPATATACPAARGRSPRRRGARRPSPAACAGRA